MNRLRFIMLLISILAIFCISCKNRNKKKVRIKEIYTDAALNQHILPKVYSTAVDTTFRTGDVIDLDYKKYIIVE